MIEKRVGPIKKEEKRADDGIAV